MHVLLISTYDLGRQPFGLASPAAWLRRAGIEVTCLDLAVEDLDETAVRAADLVAFHLPMHTATRLAVRAMARVRVLNPRAHLCCYGIYARLNEPYLRRLGAGSILSGEYEEELTRLARGLAVGEPPGGAAAGEPPWPPPRLEFLTPDRRSLPALGRYAHLHDGEGRIRAVGATEASRGCRHRCRHCPVPAVYRGAFRVVQREVVLADIRQQVAAGATHITFGDPDFLNGPRHALEIVRELHREHPELTYDCTIKIEHLLRHAAVLPELRETGCLFVVSAVESVDDRVLEILEKGHTREDFVRVAGLFRGAGLTLQPTFVAFHPWITPEGYLDLLGQIEALELVDQVAPVQLALRLLIPAGSLLLELPEVRRLAGPLDEVALAHPWRHPDPRMDRLQADLMRRVVAAGGQASQRRTLFEEAWSRAEGLAGSRVRSMAYAASRPRRPPVPFLTEPWYC